MKKFWILALWFPVVAGAVTKNDRATAEFVEHILGYLQKDYGRAVQDGKVLSAPEYEEQQHFIQSAIVSAEGFQELPQADEIRIRLGSIKQRIFAMGDPKNVAEECRLTRARLVEVAELSVAPDHWPDREHGKALFQKNCAACHGFTGHGDGPAAPGQDPPPADFHDPGMGELPPFQAYNTIRMGVPNTPMPAFAYLTAEEAWDLAFYVVSLRHESRPVAKVKAPANIGLKEIASLSDDDLIKLLPEGATPKNDIVAKLRLQRPSGDTFLPLARALLLEARDEAIAGNLDSARKKAVLSYLDGVEPVEPRLRARAPEFTLELEEKMSRARVAIESRVSLPELNLAVETAVSALDRAERLLGEGSITPAFTFTVAAGIFLREAFEAVLILITLLGVIRSIGSHKAALYVHGGWMLAVAAGLAAWFFSGWVMAISGQQREYLEGGIALFAVAVLLYFGFWLHQKTEIGKWRSFIDEMVTTAVEGKNLLALGVVSFMAVFREAFETVLFLRALMLEAGPSQNGYLLAGVLSSLVVVLFLSAALVRFSAKLPVRQLFNLSSAIMVFLALVLIGKGVHSFQETGLIHITPLPGGLRSDVLGLYPTYETLLPQLLVLVAGALVWWLGRKGTGLKEAV